jgi:hypothetical protein
MHKDILPEKTMMVLSRLAKTLKKYDAILAGGTGLALHLGHRVSVDLDFFTGKEFRVESLVSDIRKTALPFQVVRDEEDTLIAFVGGIKTALFRYEYPFLEKTGQLEGIRVAGVLDIASMKVIAISQRGTKRDFADLYFILNEIPFPRIASHMVSRFGPERLSPVHTGKSLVYFIDAESEPDPEYMEGKDPGWEKVKTFFKDHVKQLVLDLDSAIKAWGSGPAS